MRLTQKAAERQSNVPTYLASTGRCLVWVPHVQGNEYVSRRPKVAKAKLPGSRDMRVCPCLSLGFVFAGLAILLTGGSAVHAGWYVIQVNTGREQSTRQLIERVCAQYAQTTGASLLDECFTPQYQARMKVRGEWQDMEKMLLPGYLIAVTSHPGELSARLRRIPEFSRLLRMGETFVPLLEEERTWIEAFTEKGDRTVPMSVATKAGDRIVVTEGPLKGREAMITKVNRKKCLAFLELHVGGMKVTTRVGLSIVSTGEQTGE